MAFMINPNDDTAGGRTSSARPTLTPGRKTLWICGVDYGTSQAGNQKIDVRLVCVDDGGDGTEVGAYCWDTFTLTQAAAWRLSMVCRALGQHDQFDAEDQALMDEIMRRGPVVVELEEETFNGKTKVRPQRYHQHAGEIPQAWDDLVAKGEEWHDGGKAKRAGGGYGGGSGGSYGSGAPAADDIPF